MQNNQRSKGYEWKIVLILALVWGTVGLDRMAIVYLFPMIIPEFGLNNTQAGAIASILAITWAVSAWVMGHLSDRIGRKKVLLPGVIFFSLMSWFTGLTKNYLSMLVVRGLLGFGEGAVFTSSVASIAEESTPKRRGFNLGAHQSGFPLIGIGLGAMICTQLAQYFGWRPVTFIVGVPGLILAIVIAIYMREPMSTNQKVEKSQPSKSAEESNEKKSGIFEALKYRNVWVSMFVATLFMVWLFNFSTFAALFLTQIRGLSLPTAGFIISAMGFGGFVGMLLVPGLSDHFGRKPLLIISSILTGAATLWFGLAGSNPVLLFCILFVASIGGLGSFPLFLSTTTTEAVPVHLAGLAVGIPTAVGELFGATIMPIIGGRFADLFGLQAPMYLAGAGPLVAVIACLFYFETAPKVLANKLEGVTVNN